jgi:hypothetical protein
VTLSELELQAFSSFEKAGWDLAADPYHHHWGSLSRQSTEPMLDCEMSPSPITIPHRKDV